MLLEREHRDEIAVVQTKNNLEVLLYSTIKKIHPP